MLLQYCFLLLIYSNFTLGQFNDNFGNYDNNDRHNDFSKFYDEFKSRRVPNDYLYDTIDENDFNKIREDILYPFYDEGRNGKTSDLDPDIHDSNILLQKLLSFRLPFYGFMYNYIRVSLEGHLSFSNFPSNIEHPIVFPMKDWPKVNDPALIAIFYAKSRIGKSTDYDNEAISKRPGLYYSVLEFNSQPYMFKYVLKKRLTMDIREGIIGAERFDPLYAIIVTWNKVSPGGGIDPTLNKTNTYQIIIATDEVRTYAIFNYKNLTWQSDTVSGGDSVNSKGKYTAFVGFNAGNGTRSFEYLPFSQRQTIYKLIQKGFVNGFEGRHIFRIDEDILSGNCNDDIDSSGLRISISPESGNMLGGTVVYVTGPCFQKNITYSCIFHTTIVQGEIINKNQLACIQPMLYTEGYAHFQIISDRGDKYITNEENSIKYYVEIPTLADRIVHVDKKAYEKSPEKIKITWDKYNLTSVPNANVDIFLYGYRENQLHPDIVLIKNLKPSSPNNGIAFLNPVFEDEDLNVDIRYIYFGFIQVKVINESKLNTPSIWSRPIPLSWFLNQKWRETYGENWAHEMCNIWIKNDRYLSDFANDLPMCPCRKEQADFDKGGFLPDFHCYKNIDKMCDGIENKDAFHCINSAVSKYHTGQQQCCYYESGDLILTYDQTSGSKPFRAHSMGYFPYNEVFKVPSLSQWYHDRVPYYLCCKWQSDQAIGCETYRFEQRPSQDCRGYQPPAVGTVFGNSHFQTFDGQLYTFHGLGDFFLLKSYEKDSLIIQGRFQKPSYNIHEGVNMTRMIGLAVKSKNNDRIEVRLRPKEARWRYVFDVYVKRDSDSIKRAVYFDRPAFRIQRFNGMTVYTPLNILNQSEIVIVTDSGVGIEVNNQGGHMAAKVYLPWHLLNKTRGLLGSWSNKIEDDFMTPYDNEHSYTVPNDAIMNNNPSLVQERYNRFGQSWMTNQDREEGITLFSHQNGFLADRNFTCNFTLPENYTSMGTPPCDTTACSQDYYLARDNEIAKQCCDYLTTFKESRLIHQTDVVSCGVLETPRFGKKDLYSLLPGSVVKFSCDSDFILVGDRKRVCLDTGRWDYPEYGYTECLRSYEYDAGVLVLVAVILFGVLAPLILLFLFAFCYIYKKNYPGHNVRNVTEVRQLINRINPEPLTLNANANANSYDGVYYTNEPLPGKPDIDFEDKRLDVDLDEAAEIEAVNSKKRNLLNSMSQHYKKYLTKINPKLSVADRYVSNESKVASQDSVRFPFSGNNTFNENPNTLPKSDLKPIRNLDDIDFLTTSQPNLPDTTKNLTPEDKSKSLNPIMMQEPVAYKPATTTHV